MKLWQHNMCWKIYSVACNEVSFTYNMATVDSPSATLLYSAFICYQENHGPWPFVHIWELPEPPQSFQKLSLSSVISTDSSGFAVSTSSAFDGFFLFCHFLNTSNPDITGLKPPLQLRWANRVWPSLYCKSTFDNSKVWNWVQLCLTWFLRGLCERGVEVFIVKGVLFFTHLMLHQVFDNRRLEWKN